MKKYLITVLCLVLLVCAAGCSKKDNKEADTDLPAVSEKAEQKQEKANQKNKTESEEVKESESESASAENTEEVIVDVPAGTEAPVIESTEELENIVDEFNNTEDPVKKEELRKKLEAFLAQAEEASK